MDYKLIILLLAGAVCVALAQSRQYIFVDIMLNWTSAQSFCRLNFTDLATIESKADVDTVIETTNNYTGKAWIGLRDDLVKDWRWSLDDSSFYNEEEMSYRNWFPKEENNFKVRQYCGALCSDLSGQWNKFCCDYKQRFVCYNGKVDNSTSFVLSDFSANWTEAQRYCRKNYIDLASIRNQKENDIIRMLASGHNVWIGLCRSNLWSDGTMSQFQHWADTQPEFGVEKCFAASSRDSGRWSDEDCNLNLPFICYTTAPKNAENFRPSSQNETSVTLQWSKVGANVSFVLQFNGTETNIRAPGDDGPVNHTVSSLTPGTKYTFTLFSVTEKTRSSGVIINTATAPANSNNFGAMQFSESKVLLWWKQTSPNVSYVVIFNGTETNIPAPDEAWVYHTVSSLIVGNVYTFAFFSVFENIRSSGVTITANTALHNVENLRLVGQNETSITLQWDKPTNNVTANKNARFYFSFYGENISDFFQSNGSTTYTINGLKAGTSYTMMFYTVLNNFYSSGVSLFAASAPLNAQDFRPSKQSQTSITLQWNKVPNIDGYLLQFNGSETNIRARDGDEPVTHTVSSLTAGTKYKFTLFSMFKNIRSSGVTITAASEIGNPSRAICSRLFWVRSRGQLSKQRRSNLLYQLIKKDTETFPAQL